MNTMPCQRVEVRCHQRASAPRGELLVDSDQSIGINNAHEYLCQAPKRHAVTDLPALGTAIGGGRGDDSNCPTADGQRQQMHNERPAPREFPILPAGAVDVQSCEGFRSWQCPAHEGLFMLVAGLPTLGDHADRLP
jgi:hypothetical protein